MEPCNLCQASGWDFFDLHEWDAGGYDSESQPTPMYALKIGTNRREQHPWKGYIDEFKIYKRALTAQEVNNLYINDAPN